MFHVICLFLAFCIRSGPTRFLGFVFCLFFWEGGGRLISISSHTKIQKKEEKDRK